MNSSSWNDSEDMRLIAQKLGEEEKRSSLEKLKKTVEKGSSQSYNDIPDEYFLEISEVMRSALAQRLRALRAKKNRSSDEEKDEVEYIQLELPSIAGDTSNSVQGTSQSYNDIPVERRRALARRMREEENWSSDEEEDELQICSLIFSEWEIHEAINDLSALKIGGGGYGTVYKGYIHNTDVAIKILRNTSEQDMKEFNRELGALNGLRHANLVNLIGSCSELGALVYEYVPNGSLEDCLVKRSVELTWEIRTRIVYEICTTLMFLHANQPDPLVHGDLKPHNVLLDANFKTKLADFGLCRFLTQAGNSGKFHQTNVSFGTPGYIDPDFLESGIVKPAIDVYSFGKTIIRILTKQRPAEISRKLHDARKRKTLMTLVDPAVRGWPEAIVELLVRFALRCCKYERYKPEFMRKFYTDLQMKLDDIDA